MITKIKRKIYTRFFKEFQNKANPNPPINYSDIENDEKKIIDEVAQFTLTSYERIVSLIRSIKHVETNNIKGDIVECGVWKGGSMMAALKTLNALKSFNRNIYLYDTFEGMSEPTEYDKSFKGESATDAYKTKDEYWNRIKCFSTLNEVQKNIFSIGYPKDKIHFVEGKVEDTIPNVKIPEKIAILRLDTDWYESTLHELEYLFPKLVKGGILIIDDYGHWQGCKKAVDEYLDKNKIEMFLQRIDYTCRMGVKM
ncbi:TylF/MycF/NovP-related O-methyltransferase [Changchengzhania lutea]|uniref:TylF/MycF/NovP-related O-methyltransferase n=1 Tax=Changchengzhania lutea TaxID=2049305 RepID=UPI001FEAEDE0|nr:TylF/MycF/NovP-related O-methyltransferase [Changchengzhania lutea]